MPMPSCQVCDQPATHFFTTATAHADGSPGTARTVALCPAHAANHEQTQTAETLAHLLSACRSYTTLGPPPTHVLITFDAPAESRAQELAAELARSFAPTASPRLARSAWVVEWLLPCTRPAVDRWHTEAWSRRLPETLHRTTCQLNGFQFTDHHSL